MLPPSPVQTRRDSILKQQGSVKTEKRVSIKPTTTTNNSKLAASNLEYVSEKSNDASSASNSVGGSKKRQGKPPYGPRPASLVITKNDGNAHFKLVRSSSIDYDDIESQQHNVTLPRPINRTTLLEQLQEDESAPLVFTAHK